MTTITLLKSGFTKQGGAEKYARLLAHAFHEKGCRVRVLTTEPVTESFPFEVISYAPKSKTSVSRLWDFESFCDQYLKAHPTDIIFGNDRNRCQTHLRAGSGVHKAYLLHRKQYEPKWKNFRHLLNPLHTSLLHIEKLSFEHPDLKVLFVNSNLVKDEILSHYVIDPNKIEVIHNGVEWQNFQQDFDTRINTDRFELLFVGNGFARKGLKPLLKGLALLPNDSYHLTVVGNDKHQKHFFKLARGLNVTFASSQNNIRPFLQKADCLVIPSHYDPFANVTVEALAMGLYVVSSKTNGGSEVLTKETGHIIEDLSNPDAMKTALETAMSTKRDPLAIRNSVKHLDFSTQLNTYIEKCLVTS
ncbi:MAG: glycosyltransferase family 4 protein [Simkaniaceae bacterium]|nr:glycosyltransferase family 4 protein [Candidatus Sacchlamyda saccharinae]